MFEIVNGGRTDDKTPKHGYTISSPCEPEGSGELKTQIGKTVECVHVERKWRILNKLNSGALLE